MEHSHKWIMRLPSNHTVALHTVIHTHLHTWKHRAQKQSRSPSHTYIHVYISALLHRTQNGFMVNYNDGKTHHDCIEQIPQHVHGKKKKKLPRAWLLNFTGGHKRIGWLTERGERESKSMTAKKRKYKKPQKRQDFQSRCLFDRLSTLHLQQQKWWQHLSRSVASCLLPENNQSTSASSLLFTAFS